MSFSAAIDRALQEPTLVKALSYISLWECERVIPVARRFLNDEENGNAERGPNGQGWDTCFEYLIKEVIRKWNEIHVTG
jgi:hypothetical protein